jgi:hypothetical protein
MSVPSADERFPDIVPVDGDTVADICWLLTSLEEYARMGDLEGVNELIRYAHPHLSPDGLANVAAGLTARLRRHVEILR